MPFATRITLIKEIEIIRQSKVICFLNSMKPNVHAQMSEDAVRVIFDHLLKIGDRPAKKIDIFLCSNGGAGTVPWRLVALLREFAESVGVLIPYRAYSAATLLSLGADEIVMHPFAEMGPIDPTVSNEYNPFDPNSKRQLGINVEDVTAYISFIKSTVGIQHEEELVKVIEILANKIHPLALGNVERFISQSRMIAKKILSTHMKDVHPTTIDDIIETLAAKLYFHGHPINRREAKEELKLKVVYPEAVLEAKMWELYLNFEADFDNRTIFDPMASLIAAAPAPIPSLPPYPPTGAQMAFVPPGVSAAVDLTTTIVESATLSSRFEQKFRFVSVGPNSTMEPIIRQETLAQGWVETPAPPQA